MQLGRRTFAVAGLVLGATGGTMAQPANPMEAWKKRASAYAAALPEPLPGWQAGTPETSVSNSAVSGREVSGYRHYRLGKHPAQLDSITIGISNNPDGSARYPIDQWKDEAKRTAANMSKTTIAGREAMTGKSGQSTYIYFLMPNNLFVSVAWQEAHMSRDNVDLYIKALDFNKIGALASK